MSDALADINQLIAAQRGNLTDSYMVGLYNGLLIARSCLDGGNPEFVEGSSLVGRGDFLGSADFGDTHE